jgi:large subunit ribosomal protein L9
MKVILKETINTLGIIGSEVEVKNGYARNFLFPQKKAVPATQRYRKMLEHEKAKFEIQIIKEKKIAEEMAKMLSGVECTISAKTKNNDELYGSVSTKDILNILEAKNITIEKRMLLLKTPIKTTGVYKVPVRLYTDIEAFITINVIPENEISAS